jgi:hypothetical protein
MKKVLLYFSVVIGCLYWAHYCNTMATLSQYSKKAATKIKSTAKNNYHNIRAWIGYKPIVRPQKAVSPLKPIYQPTLYTERYGTMKGQFEQRKAAQVEAGAREVGKESLTASAIGAAILAGTFSIIEPIALVDYWTTLAVLFPPVTGASFYSAYKVSSTFELAMARIKNAARKRFMTDVERIDATYQKFLHQNNVKISDISIDIINKPLLSGNLNLLQAVLINKQNLIADTIIKLLDAGANPSMHEPGTPHPIECILSNRNAQSGELFNERWNILLALVNPDLVPSEQLIMLSEDIESKLIHTVHKEREKLLIKTRKSTDKDGNFIIKNDADVDLLETILTLDQIMEALKLRTKMFEKKIEPL